MRNIYVDANIYLLFYCQKEGKFNTLLETLIELKEKIFISKQIVYEVERNKLKKFSDSFEEYIKRANEIGKVDIPTHFDSSSESDLDQWNQGRAELYNKIKGSNKKLEKIRNDLYIKIHNGEDEVSVKLKKIFDLAKDAEPVILEKARLRRERGNPPGKRTDTLGDQISWEQFLDSITSEKVDEVWMITKDSDYFIKDHENKIYINSLLKKDVEKLDVKKIKINDDISKAIKEYSNTYPITNKPTESELEEFIKVEEKLNQNFILTGGTASTSGYTIPTIMNFDFFSRLTGYCYNCKTNRVLIMKENKSHQYASPYIYCSVCGSLVQSHGF